MFFTLVEKIGSYRKKMPFLLEELWEFNGYFNGHFVLSVVESVIWGLNS